MADRLVAARLPLVGPIVSFVAHNWSLMSKILTPPPLLAGLVAVGFAGSLLWAASRPEPDRTPAQQVLGIASTSRIQSLDPHEPAQVGTRLLVTKSNLQIAKSETPITAWKKPGAKSKELASSEEQAKW